MTPSPMTIQDPNAFNMAYSPFPLIRMAAPQQHQIQQPPLIKELTTPTSQGTSSPSTSITTLDQDLGDNTEASMRISRPPNAYLLFNREMRKILKDQDPSMKVADISREIGFRWRTMPQDQKDQYLDQAKKLREEQKDLHPHSMYIRRSKAEMVKEQLDPNQQLQLQLQNLQQQQQQRQQQLKQQENQQELPELTKMYERLPRKRKRRRRDKNTNIPKHPLSAYMWFLTESRPEVMRTHPGSNVGQISKLCAKKWNAMSEVEKTPWETKARADKERYSREMQVYALQSDHSLGRGTRQKYRSLANKSLHAKTATHPPNDNSITINQVTNSGYKLEPMSAVPNTTGTSGTPTPSSIVNALYYTPANTNPPPTSTVTTNNSMIDNSNNNLHQQTSHFQHQLSAPTSPSSILQSSSLPIAQQQTLNPNALLQDTIDDSITTTTTDLYSINTNH